MMRLQRPMSYERNMSCIRKCQRYLLATKMFEMTFNQPAELKRSDRNLYLLPPPRINYRSCPTPLSYTLPPAAKNETNLERNLSLYSSDLPQ